jgi:hypothetical protein
MDTAVFTSWLLPPSACPAGWSLLAAALAVCLLAGCSRFSSDPRPVPDSTFTRLLTELHLAAARRDLDAPYPPDLRDSVLARYGVRKAAFDTTLQYYSRRPEAFKALYQSVIDTLRALQRGPGVPSGVPDSLVQSGRRSAPPP